MAVSPPLGTSLITRDRFTRRAGGIAGGIKSADSGRAYSDLKADELGIQLHRVRERPTQLSRHILALRQL